MKKILVAAVLATLFGAHFAYAQKVELSVDLSKAGTKIERNIQQDDVLSELCS